MSEKASLQAGNPSTHPQAIESDKEYLRQHGIPMLFNELTQELFRHRPEQPIPFLLQFLKQKRAQLEEQKNSEQ